VVERGRGLGPAAELAECLVDLGSGDASYLERDGPRSFVFADFGKARPRQLLASVEFGPQLGKAALPSAAIQEYEGSFYSLIKAVLAGTC
jgi:hypothetical protein